MVLARDGNHLGRPSRAFLPRLVHVNAGAVIIKREERQPTPQAGAKKWALFKTMLFKLLNNRGSAADRYGSKQS